MYKYLLIILFLIVILNLKGQNYRSTCDQGKPVNDGYYQLPFVIDEGLILTDEKYKKLYLYSKNTKSPVVILDEKADYKSINISYDKERIGLLLLSESGKYIPAVYWIKDKILKVIGEAGHNVSEVSFAERNTSCYAQDSTIIVLGERDSLIYKSKFTINKVNIAPDGKHIAVCSRKGKLYVLEIDSLKMNLITNEELGFDPVWSPDAQKLVYSSGLDLIVWDKRCNEKFFIGQGIAPNWSINSEYIVYQKNNSIKMKFVNADIFVSKFNGSSHFQLTKTDDKYEMQPVFGFNDDLYYMTYENRRLIQVRFGNENFDILEKEVLLEFK